MGTVVLIYRNVCVCVLGFILDKSLGVDSPKRLENANILIANTCTPSLSLRVPRL